MSGITPPAPGGATPPEPTPATGTPPAGGATPPQPPTLTLEEALKALADAQHARDNATQERDRQRARLTELEAKQKAADEASMTELQKAQSRAAEHERALAEQAIEMQQLRVHTVVNREAAKLGIIDPEVAARLIWDQVDFDAQTGQPTNIDKLLTKLAADKPYLIGKPGQTPAPQTGATNPPRPGTGQPSNFDVKAGERPSLYDSRVWKRKTP
jgi:hypothetical protein